MDKHKPNATESEAPALISVPDILKRGSFSRSHLYGLLAKGQFPAPAIRLSRFTRWRAEEVNDWLADPAAWIAAHANVEARTV